MFLQRHTSVFLSKNHTQRHIIYLTDLLLQDSCIHIPVKVLYLLLYIKNKTNQKALIDTNVIFNVSSTWLHVFPPGRIRRVDSLFCSEPNYHCVWWEFSYHSINQWTSQSINYCCSWMLGELKIDFSICPWPNAFNKHYGLWFLYILTTPQLFSLKPPPRTITPLLFLLYYNFFLLPSNS